MTSLQDDDIISIRDEKKLGEFPHLRVFRFIGDKIQLEMSVLRKLENPFPYQESLHDWEAEKIAKLLRMKSKSLKALPTSNPQNHDFLVVSK